MQIQKVELNQHISAEYGTVTAMVGMVVFHLLKTFFENPPRISTLTPKVTYPEKMEANI